VATPHDRGFAFTVWRGRVWSAALRLRGVPACILQPGTFGLTDPWELPLNEMKLVKVMGRGHILWYGPVVWVERARRARIVRDVQKVLDLDNCGVIDSGHIQFEISGSLAADALPEHKLIAADLLGCCVR